MSASRNVLSSRPKKQNNKCKELLVSREEFHEQIGKVFTSLTDAVCCTCRLECLSVFCYFAAHLTSSALKVREICISLFIVRYFYTANIVVILCNSFFRTPTFPRFNLSCKKASGALMFLRDKLLCQLVLLLPRINSSVVQFFTHFSAVPQKLFRLRRKRKKFCVLLIIFSVSNRARLVFFLLRAAKKICCC